MDLDQIFSRNLQVASDLASIYQEILQIHNISEVFPNERERRAEPAVSQAVFQYSPAKKKCKHSQSLGVASGANALSYMSFVAAVITLVLNINNNINANNNNLNRVNLNFGSNKNTVTSLNQNVGNNFNLMFPPGKKKKKKRSTSQKQGNVLLYLAQIGGKYTKHI